MSDFLSVAVMMAIVSCFIGFSYDGLLLHGEASFSGDDDVVMEDDIEKLEGTFCADGGFDVVSAGRGVIAEMVVGEDDGCLLYTSPSPRDQRGSRMPSSA